MSIFAEELCRWYEENKRDLPWRKTNDPYAIWVSEIMLQQTRVEAVKPYYERFLSAFPTIEALANADEEILNKLWQGLGYYSRARNMQKAAKDCVLRFGGKLPEDPKNLKSLCGIGDYTAGAIASFAYGVPTPAVDGNVQRVLARCLLIEEICNSPEALKKMKAFIQSEIPKDKPGVFNQALIELGATVCGPDREARCGGCPLLRFCKAFKEGRTEELPARKAKKERRVEEYTPFILLFEDSAALEKRPGKGLLAGLWQPPMRDGFLDEAAARAYIEENGGEILEIASLPEATHIFTHIVWRMRGYLARLSAKGNFSLYTKEERAARALPSAFKAYKEWLS